jgi:hypothetical protein
LLGPHDEYELQPHAREQGCFPWPFGGKTWFLAPSGWRSRAALHLWLKYYNIDTILVLVSVRGGTRPLKSSFWIIDLAK